jgi:hypothetical protein
MRDTNFSPLTARKIYRLALGPRCAALPVSAALIYSPCPHSQRLQRLIFTPVQLFEKQRSQKAKTMFETRETTFEVFFLRSYVGIRACGRFFEVLGQPFFRMREKGTCFRKANLYQQGSGATTSLDAPASGVLKSASECIFFWVFRLLE